jgi:hypothetical protein
MYSSVTLNAELWYLEIAEPDQKGFHRLLVTFCGFCNKNYQDDSIQIHQNIVM